MTPRYKITFEFDAWRSVTGPERHGVFGSVRVQGEDRLWFGWGIAVHSTEDEWDYMEGCMWAFMRACASLDGEPLNAAFLAFDSLTKNELLTDGKVKRVVWMGR